jgi:exopolysaccharide biosynthesis protein
VTAPSLPATIAPPPPFPLVVAQSRATELVAPGIRRATYRLQTSDGPLVVNVVAVDPREPTVHFESVVARDRMISSGETISSMAQRTNAVAGINADYFDIGNTNQPLNAVVNNGALLRTPSKRIVMDVRTDRSVHFENLSFSGSLVYGGASVPLTAVNEWPPQGGASFLTPAYGSLKAAPGVTLAELVAADPVHLATAIAGTYRVASIAQSEAQTVEGPLLAFGPAALAVAPPPSAGDSVTVAATTVPPLDTIATAVGGGPLLVSGGEPVDDPNAPAPEETDVRFPVAGAGCTAGGDVVFVTVDGREAALSIGVTRPEFAALFLGFGATDAMAFDSGGSATLVARVLGDATASVLNAPSDGEERPVADGLFIYSNAPLGPPAQLVVRPSPIVALPHATIPVRLLLVDAAGHALGATHLAGGDVLVAGESSEERRVGAGGIVAGVTIDVVQKIARLAIAPDNRNPDPGATVAFNATGFDARGRPVELGDALRWSADRGSFSKPGTYRAGRRDARIVARAPGTQAEYDLPVGRHDEALPFFDASHVSAWAFSSAPRGSAGSLAIAADPPQLTLAYDFSGGERAAYADADLALPGEPQTFSIEIRGDRSGVGVRAAFVNRFGERRALTLAKAVDWSGWEARAVRIPDDLNPPVRLVALYAVDSLATQTRAAGTLGFRNATVAVAGTP